MHCSLEQPASKLLFRGYCLRPLEVRDAPSIVAAIEESLPQLREFLPFAHQPVTVEEQIQRVRSLAVGAQLGFTLCQGDRLLAFCGLHPRTPLNPRGTEIGFWTRSSEAGRGLATLMTRVLVIYAFDGLGMDRVQIVHNRENRASQKVIERCGFQLEGTLRNALAAAAPGALAGGLTPCREALQYALIPSDRPGLPWYAEWKRDLRVFDVLGQELGPVWRAG